MKPTIMQAIYSLGGENAVIRVVGDTYEGIEWIDKPKFTKTEIKNELKKLEELEKFNEYKNLRAREYPSMGDQLDALFHAGLFPSEMAAKIQEVKDKYPKS